MIIIGFSSFRFDYNLPEIVLFKLKRKIRLEFILVEIGWCDFLVIIRTTFKVGSMKMENVPRIGLVIGCFLSNSVQFRPYEKLI